MAYVAMFGQEKLVQQPVHLEQSIAVQSQSSGSDIRKPWSRNLPTGAANRS